MVPHVIVVGDVRLELSPALPAANGRSSAPTTDDGNRLVREYGGKALEEALAEAEQVGMEPRE